MKMPGNRPMAVAMQERRRSSAASPHANKSKYNRKRDKRHMNKEW